MSSTSILKMRLHKCNIMIKLFIALSTFIQTCVCITFNQTLILVFCHYNSNRLHHLIDFTKESFISLLINMLYLIAPSSVRITTDSSSVPKGTFYKDPKNGRLASRLKERSIIIANHQIYTDWVFIWWLTSTAHLAGKIYIMLKESLQKIPVLGFGMKNYKFIFMSRKWEKDRLVLHNSLGTLDANARGIGPISGRSPARVDPNGEMFWDTTDIDPQEEKWPYCLILFPEGTNLSPETRKRSYNYANKVGKKPFENLLLPHVTGLRQSLLKLKPSLDVVYDFTIGYSGVKKEEYGETIYKLTNVIFKGSPKLVDMHIKAYYLNEIPIDDEEKFADWIYGVWAEKDKLLNTFYEKGSFNLDPEPEPAIIDEFKMSAFPFLLPLFSTYSLLFSLCLSIWYFWKYLL